MSQKRKTVEIYRDVPSAVESKQPPEKGKSSKPTLGKEEKEALTRTGEVSLAGDNVTKSPRKALRKGGSEVGRESSRDVLDEEARTKSSQKEILSKTKLEVGQIPSESAALKATTLTPSQKGISSDSQHENRPTQDEVGLVEATTAKIIDEPLAKAKDSPARSVSSDKEAPTVAPIGYPGLINPENSCYQNTAFQILANTRRFADHVKGTRWTDKEPSAAADRKLLVKQSSICKKRKTRSKARKTSGSSQYANRPPTNSTWLTSNRSVASSLSRLFRMMHSQLDSDYSIDPGFATKAMSSLPAIQSYSGDVQEDSGEFLGHLIDGIHNEEEKLSQIEPETTEVRKMFGGMEEQKVSISIASFHRSQVANSYQIICSGCRHVSTQTHNLLALTLDMPEDEEPTTVEALLKNYSDTVGLPEDYKCEKCHEVGKSGKALQMTEVPPYLIVLLNRTKVYIDKKFNVQLGKNKTRVPIPIEVIDLSDSCSPKEPSDKKSYAVRGVGIHKGAT